MRVLSWNLFHGRADPPAGRPLLGAFGDALAGWAWDVALLQEVPPWWPSELARRCGADHRTSRTSRNQLLPLRREIASRAPDLLRSNGGGANAILVRPPWTVVAHGRRRLRLRPERRVVHAVRLRDPAGGPFDDAWVGNLHAQFGRWDGAGGTDPPLADLRRSIAQVEAWAGGPEPGTADDRWPAANAVPKPGAVGPTAGQGPPLPATPLILGGDLNLPRDLVAERLPGAWRRIASGGPDHVVGRGAVAAAPSQRLERGALSDHSPLAVSLRPPA